MAKGRKNQVQGLSKAQRKDDIERKRDERARRTALRRERDAKQYYPVEDDENYAGFSNQLLAEGLKIKDIPGDGNCLFRALADQFEGDHQLHRRHRTETVHFMRCHTEDFAPFIDLDTFASFEKYLESLGNDGTFAGNDAIVAFARNHGVNVIIHQFNNPRFIIEGIPFVATGMTIELHLAYHNGEHYSSLRRLNDPGSGPGYPYHSTKYSEVSYPNLSASKLAGQQSCTVSAANKETTCHQLTLTEEQERIVQQTGCKDLELIKKTTEEYFDDVEGAITYIMQVMSLCEDQDGSKILHEKVPGGGCCVPLKDEKVIQERIKSKGAVNVAKQGGGKAAELSSHPSKGKEKQHHLSNRQRKELAKESKKKRREEIKKAQAKEQNGLGDSQESDCRPAKDVGTVQI